MFDTTDSGAAAVLTPAETIAREQSRSAPLGPVDGHWWDVPLEAAASATDVPDGGWEAMAEALQDLLVGADVELRRADAQRTSLLVEAYEASMRDLGERFGADLAHRGSRGAQTVFKSFALRLGLSPLTVAHLVDSATVLRDDLPSTWEQYLAGATTWRAADLVVAEGESLPEAVRSRYDEQAARMAVELPIGRLRTELRRIRERLQDGTADERAKRTRERRSVIVERGRDGEATLVITGPAVPIIGFDEALTRAAVAARMHPDETRSIGQLRQDIVMDLLVEGVKQSADPAWAGLAVPQRKGVVPAPVLTVPALAALGASGEQAHLAGYGPIALATAKELAGAATSFIRVLTDPVTGVRLDMDRRKRIPPVDMRRWVVVRDETCRFPGCMRPAHLCDLDHAQEWQDAGVTAAGNLVSACRPDHAAKSAELWADELHRDGRVDWTDPWGNVFEDPPAVVADPAPPRFLPPDDACPF